MKTTKSKKIVSAPILIISMLLIGYISVVYIIPFAASHLFDSFQQSDKKIFIDESKRLQPSLSKLSCIQKTSLFSRGIDTSPNLEQTYICQTGDASKIDSVLTGVGLSRIDPSTKMPYPTGTYIMQNANLKDKITITTNNNELRLLISHN